MAARRWTSVPFPRLLWPPRMESRKFGVRIQDLRLKDAWMDGGERGPVSPLGAGSSPILLRHLSASESHGDGGWSPNRRSSGRSPEARSSSWKKGCEGNEEATLMGRDDMVS